MFTDDCIIFCGVTKTAARTIKQTLHHYCSVSGQLINYHKSEVQFSRNVSTINKKRTVQILQVTPTRTSTNSWVVSILMFLKGLLTILMTWREKSELAGLEARKLLAVGKMGLIKLSLLVLEELVWISKKFCRDIEILIVLIETFLGKITVKAIITAGNSKRLVGTKFVSQNVRESGD